ncbi:MAG: hypothetical protein GWN07_24425, partial [Actinobacteria bacterium]|nr:DNA-3-methyladenine glycosylase I [Actinomycetota bacterium]NIV57215.1 hypothetical protein [Actinomycetota bacterium]NIX22801.1 hypothetical protein [Actinomycetota bacterium]
MWRPPRARVPRRSRADGPAVLHQLGGTRLRGQRRVSLELGDDGALRCAWGAGDPLYQAYHDEEWGRPVVDDDRLFEKIVLEGFQAGLAWITI